MTVDQAKALFTIAGQNFDTHKARGATTEYKIVYSAHRDHFAIGEKVNSDSNYNGAYDDANGTAVLQTIGAASQAIKAKPGRSILLLSVTSEEPGCPVPRILSQQLHCPFPC